MGSKLGSSCSSATQARSWDDVQKTLKMVRECMPDDIGISVSYPLPGTKFYESVKLELGEKQNWIDSEDLAMLYRGPFPTEFYRILHGRVHYEFRTRRVLQTTIIARRCISAKKCVWHDQERNPIEAVSVMENNIDTIAEAFSRTAEKYDSFADDHPNQTRMRNKVYTHFQRFIPSGSRILELNCGTGTDAVELAQRGYKVHATDIAPGMLERLQDKVHQNNLGDHISFQQCSFTELDQVQGAPFDAVFSNLGGLNCIPDLSPVIKQLPKVLRPNGLITWVLMPPVCLWEMAEIFRGHPRLAFRRLARNGTTAHLEGLYFTIYYFTPKKVLEWFGDEFDCLAIEGLSVITPTAESKNFAKRYTRLYRTLSWLDDRLASRYPWCGWGDFFIITMRFMPK